MNEEKKPAADAVIPTRTDDEFFVMSKSQIIELYKTVEMLAFLDYKKQFGSPRPENCIYSVKVKGAHCRLCNLTHSTPAICRKACKSFQCKCPDEETLMIRFKELLLKPSALHKWNAPFSALRLIVCPKDEMKHVIPKMSRWQKFKEAFSFCKKTKPLEDEEI